MGSFDKLKQKIKAKLVVEKTTAITVPVMNGELLKGHTAFITGATGGIGFAIAERFIANGCNVVLAGRNEDKLLSACKKLSVDKYVVVDFTKYDEYPGVIERSRKLLKSDERIDILVNCAGTHGPSDFWNITPKDWDNVMDANLKSMYFMCQAFATYMRDNDVKGHILNISSASALKPGKTPYEISKNGVRALTLGIATECIKYGIVVNCLAPGPTATAMINRSEQGSLTWNANPAGRIALPEEIANWAVFMASDLGNYVVGNSFYVTGGSGTICIDK